VRRSTSRPDLRKGINMFNLLNLRFAVLVGMVAELAAPPIARANEKAQDEPTPVVGIRGLDKDAAAGKISSARDYAAIKRLENVKVSPEELEDFRKAGNF
jgi:hypothetical protein